MPLAKRIIPCLDVTGGCVVKGVNFLQLKKAGGADELVFLDITASSDNRDTLRDVVEGVAKAINIPFTVGGGIRNESDARLVLCSGADKTSVNTAAVENPALISNLADLFGQQCVVVAIDAKRNRTKQKDKTTVETAEGQVWFEVYTYGGRKPTGIDAIQWATEAVELGAGEFLLTSMDCDGTENGFDLDLTRTISERVNVPVIASGGAGKPEHFLDAFTKGKADAALAASVFHYNKYPVAVVKDYLRSMGVTIRP
jgi:cyclase